MNKFHNSTFHLQTHAHCLWITWWNSKVQTHYNHIQQIADSRVNNTIVARNTLVHTGEAHTLHTTDLACHAAAHVGTVCLACLQKHLASAQYCSWSTCCQDWAVMDDMQTSTKSCIAYIVLYEMMCSVTSMSTWLLASYSVTVTVNRAN